MFKRLFSAFGKKSPAPDLGAVQDEAVRGVVGDITDLQDGAWEGRDWVHIAVNHEVLIEDGRRSSTQAVVLAHRPGGEIEHLGFRLSMGTKAALLAVREAMVAGGLAPWTILDLTIERDGTYDFRFGYGPPPRIDGDLLHSPLKNLLQQYRAAKGE